MHEWSYPTADRPQVQISELGEVSYEQEPTENVTTWVYDEGSYTPIGKLVNGERYSIVSDYLGRPVQCFDDQGAIVWETNYDLYGRLKHLNGERYFIPFRQMGQYEDEHLGGLYYNRFRYYDSTSGMYLSQDPIGLNGGMALYGYVHDSNGWVDVFGLAGTGGAYLFGFENGDMYIGKGEIQRMFASIRARLKGSPLSGRAHLSTDGNNELGKMVEYKTMDDAGFEPGGRKGVAKGYLNNHMSGKSAWEDPKNKHLQGKATALAAKLRADYDADVKARSLAKAKKVCP